MKLTKTTENGDNKDALRKGERWSMPKADHHQYKAEMMTIFMFRVPFSPYVKTNLLQVL